MDTLTTAPLVLARVIRLVSVSIAVGLMAAVGVLDGGRVQSSESVPQAPAPTPALNASLNRAIDDQQALGRVCQGDPRLTDVVLFQFTGTEEVVVLKFDEALAETAKHSGWVRGYCA